MASDGKGPYDSPRFDSPQLLADGRTWTAKFDTFNERTYDIYYIIHVTGLDGSDTRIVAQLSWDDGKPTDDDAAAIERALANIAETGVTNTTNQGYYG
jgi:hypothetical protein